VTIFEGDPGVEKLEQHVVDFEKLQDWTNTGTGCTVAFCTMGVGARAQSMEEFYRVDVDYAERFAKLCEANSVKHFTLLSAAVAVSAKAEIEKRLQALNFQRLSFFRPALIVEKTARTVDGWDPIRQFGRATLLYLDIVLPNFLNSVKSEDLARAMRINAEIQGKTGTENLHPRFEEFLKLDPREKTT